MRRPTRMFPLVIVAACGGGPGAKAPPAATVEHRVTEAQLTRVILSTEAIQRLGIETEAADSGTTTAVRVVGGEVVTPPGGTFAITAPGAGTVLAPDGGALPVPGRRVTKGQHLLRILALPPDQTSVTEAVAVAEARLAQAEAEGKRIADLFTDHLVSARDYERAKADLISARAGYATAAARRDQVEHGATTGRNGLASLLIVAPSTGVIRGISVGPGQSVAAGAPLLDLAAVDRLWVRVPLYPGDVRGIASDKPAAVVPLGGVGSTPIAARPVAGPPVADPAAASIDIFFELIGSTTALRPGERVSVSLPLTTTAKNPSAVTVPLSALVMDAGGGTWVYERADSVTFVRRRVEVARFAGARALLSRGIAAGTRVVTAGAAELFGTEFGPGK